MSYQDLLNARVREQVINTPSVQKAIKKNIAHRSGELYNLRLQNKLNNPINHIRNPVSKILNGRLKNKKVLRKSPQAVIVENQPVYTEDRNRFFNDEVIEDRRQLFFK